MAEALQLRLRRGTTAESDAFTGADDEVSVDTDLTELRLHDGATAGGKIIKPGAITDQDRDTLIEVERTADQDVLWFKTGGADIMRATGAAAAPTTVDLTTGDQDGTDDVVHRYFGLGKTGDANTETLTIGWNAAGGYYEFTSGKTGSGTVRDQHFGPVANQLVLPSAGGLTVNTNALVIDSSKRVGVQFTPTSSPFGVGNVSDTNQALQMNFPDASTAQIFSTRQGAGANQDLRLNGQINLVFFTNGAESARIFSNRDIRLSAGSSALATAATGGFPGIPSMAGTPTGTPTNASAGFTPIVIDTSGSKIWVYFGGGWKSVAVA